MTEHPMHLLVNAYFASGPDPFDTSFSDNQIAFGGITDECLISTPRGPQLLRMLYCPDLRAGPNIRPTPRRLLRVRRLCEVDHTARSSLQGRR
eukprot:scaffold1534_cov267-Pinguiococcus_pyrenoidosus.AAC.28